eukprot:m.141089 g.141089  ORF g.141089 m.141089 type:complete len:190 (+) comp16124_c0_seq4:49-618(+)
MEVQAASTNDIEGITKLRSAAFIDKTSSCYPPSEAHQDNVEAYNDYAKNHPTKIEHCGIIIKDGEVVGAIQVVLPGDIADISMPSGIRHANKPKEAYVEWVGVLESGRGQGIGSLLLAWADELAIANGCTHITLEVVTQNTRAAQLYERKGYVVQPRYDCCGMLITFCLLWCCLGCKYTGAKLMKKDLV